jgi:uncharacterized protein with ATP-grasp and redox domains
MVVPDDIERKRLMHNVLEWMSDIDLDASPPAAVQMIHRRLRGLLPSNDPYRAAKDRQNNLAASLIPSIRKKIVESFDPVSHGRSLCHYRQHHRSGSKEQPGIW